jgi:DNA-binding FrmR family transcriptional regulator
MKPGMGHTQRNKKLLDRVRRIRGQINAVEKAVEDERECIAVLQTLAACRGAINGLLAEIIEGHVEHHLVDAKGYVRPEATQELMDVVRAYFK